MSTQQGKQDDKGKNKAINTQGLMRGNSWEGKQEAKLNTQHKDQRHTRIKQEVTRQRPGLKV